MTNNTDRLDGWVYFIKADGAIKIGFSIHPKRRVLDLQTSHHVELELLAWVSTSILTERQAHEKFDHLKIRGEWFRAEPDLIEFIAGLEPSKAEVVEIIPAPILTPAPARRIAVQTLRTAKAAKPYMTQQIRDLIMQRNAYGADTPRGHAASNLIEQLQHLATAEGSQRENLLKAIPHQMARLAG